MRKNVVATLVLLAACSCGSEDQAPRVSPIEVPADVHVDTDVHPDASDVAVEVEKDAGAESTDVIVNDETDVNIERPDDSTSSEVDAADALDDVNDAQGDEQDADADTSDGADDAPDGPEDVHAEADADSLLPCPQTVNVIRKLGEGGKVSAPTSGYAWTSGAQLSVEFWVKFNSTNDSLNNANWVGVGTRASLGSPAWTCYANPKLGTINFATKSSTDVLEVGWVPSLGTWYHIACQHDGAARMVFVNGSLLAKEPHVADVDTTSNVIVFAAKSASEYLTWGDYHLREVRVGGTALYVTDFEPSWMLTQATGTSALYRLDEGTGATVHDALGIAPDLTIVDAFGVPIDGDDSIAWETVQSQCND